MSLVFSFLSFGIFFLLLFLQWRIFLYFIIYLCVYIYIRCSKLVSWRDYLVWICFFYFFFWKFYSCRVDLFRYDARAFIIILYALNNATQKFSNLTIEYYLLPVFKCRPRVSFFYFKELFLKISLLRFMYIRKKLRW